MLRRALSLALALCAVLLAESARAERLTVRSSYHQAGLVLHDLAKDADEPRALAYVRQVHARHAEKATGLELRDARGAAKALEATEGNCIAFTSRGRASPILRRLLEPFRKSKEGRRLAERVLNAKPGERWIFAAPKPGTDRTCVVLAAGSNADLVGIADLSHGVASFHVWSGEREEAGYYDRELRFEPQELALRDALDDAASFFRKVEEIHPDPLARRSFDAYRRHKESVFEEIRNAAGPKKKVTARALASALSRAAAWFGDGHTFLSWSAVPLDGKEGEAWYPPFVLEHRNGELFIEAVVGEHASRLAGRRVAKANGMPFAEFMGPILERCSGELLAHRISRFEGKQGFYWWLTRMLDGKALALEVVEQDGKTSAVTLAPIRAKEFFALAKEAGNRQSSRDLSYSFLDDGMAILRLPSSRLIRARNARAVPGGARR